MQDLQLLDLRDGYLPSMIHTTMQAWGQQGRWIYCLVESVDVTSYHVGYTGAFLVMFNRFAPLFTQRSGLHALNKRQSMLVTHFASRASSIVPKEQCPLFILDMGALVWCILNLSTCCRRMGDKLVQHKLLSPFLRRAATLPILLSAIDLLEDCAQASVVTIYSDSWQVVPQYWEYLMMLASTMNQVKWICVRMGFTLFMLEMVLLVVSLVIGALNNDQEPD